MSPTPESKRLVQVLDEIKNSDLTASRNEYHFWTPVLVDKLAPLLKDQRDVPMLCLLLNIAEFVVCGVTFIYGLNLYWAPNNLLVRNLAGLVYVVTLLLLFMERFLLCLHFSSHRVIFHNNALNTVITWLYTPFFGVPCGVYKLHHVIMHHIENNHELDISSTERFQRDSWSDFFTYWVHFALLIMVELIHYTIRTAKYSWTQSILTGLFIWMSTIYLLARYVNVVATVWVFLVPHIVAMSAMAFGNWAQHMFVNPEDRYNNFALTYNCIDTPGNQTTFNDGYHIIHHLNARLHWSEIPNYFYENREKHFQNGALTFRGVHFFDVGILVMTKQLRKLAECYVHLGSRESAPTVDAVEEKLRSMLVPCPQDAAPVSQTAAKKEK